MEPGDPVAPTGESTPAPSGRNARNIFFLIVALALVLAGFLLFRRGGGPATAPAAPTVGGTTPPAGLNVVEAPVKLTPEATLVADRFKCLCGNCQDTLGKCVCTRDKGSNEMKTALNRIVAEKKSLAEIEAAMVDKFGSGVLAAPGAQDKPPAGK
jgi:hypothetical protein